MLEQFGGSPQAHLLADGLARDARAAGPRAEARERLGVPPEAFVAAYIGRLSAWKGQDVFAQAMRRTGSIECGRGGGGR